MQIKNKFTKLTNTERIFNNKETIHQIQSLVVMLIDRIIRMRLFYLCQNRRRLRVHKIRTINWNVIRKKESFLAFEYFLLTSLYIFV